MAVPWLRAMILLMLSLKKAKSKLGEMAIWFEYSFKNHLAVNSIVFIRTGKLVVDVFWNVTLTKHMRTLLFSRKAVVESIN